MDNETKKTLRATADKLRSNMDAAEYKHTVLGLIFLKYIEDSFEEFRSTLVTQIKDPESEPYWEDASEEDIAEELEDRDVYLSQNVFWVPEESRWENIKNKAKQSDIGKIIDDAMVPLKMKTQNLREF